ncbi:MAG TPA: dihydrolipoyl dehydrogenase [Candidatus Limiplasma sp.]|nr:dihydrolipoyl dehydrogenase [Candidatus Limiplasma sp.]
MTDRYDLIILGGGPAGYRAAERAAHEGLKTLLFEKRALGGVCLNEGCIPSKTLLYSAKLYDYAKGGAKKYGVTCDNATLDHVAVIRRKQKIVKKLTMGIAAQLKAGNVTVVQEEAAIEGRVDGGYTVSANGTQYSGSRLLLATGSMPVLPPIDGLQACIASGFALTNREILDMREVPKALVVVGGGVIGLEMASYFASAGSEVTVVEMLNSIGGPIDAEIADMLKVAYEKKGVRFKLGTTAKSFAEGKVTVSAGEETEELACDKVLVSIGRRPVLPNGSDKLNITMERGKVITDDHMLTSELNVYAAGDINGKSMLAHTAYREAEVAVNHMLGKPDTMDYSAIPAVIYTNPEVASCGETLASAKEKGIDAIEKKVPMSYSGRFVAENEGGDGLFKMVLNQTGKILGVSMIGNPASEIIFGASLMIGKEMRANDLQRIVFPHPTVGEIYRETIF